MASPAEIAKTLPDTLPEDFGEWDGEGSPAGSPPADTGVAEPAPGPVAAPKAPARTRESHAVSASATADMPRKTAGGTPVTVHGDNRVYQARLRPVVVDRSPNAAALRPANARTVEAPHATPHRSNGASAERTRHASAAATATLSEADEVLFHSFRSTGTATETEVKKPASNRKWMVVAAIAVASVVLLCAILIPLLRHSSATAPKQIAEQVPSTSEMQLSDNDVKPSPYAATPSAPAKPASGSAAQQPQQPTDDQSADNDASASVPVQSQMMNEQLSAPSRIPQTAKAAPVEDAPPPPSLGASGMQGLSGSAMGNVFSGQGQLRVKAAPPKIVTVSSGVAVGMLIQKTTPVYPPIAKTAGVSGTVVLDAVISKSGNIQDLRVVSGPVMLRKAAEDAVRTWRYRPYKLNNEPTEVETTINVIFALAG
jgi:periplasmic protein TonB